MLPFFKRRLADLLYNVLLRYTPSKAILSYALWMGYMVANTEDALLRIRFWQGNYGDSFYRAICENGEGIMNGRSHMYRKELGEIPFVFQVQFCGHMCCSTHNKKRGICTGRDMPACVHLPDKKKVL